MRRITPLAVCLLACATPAPALATDDGATYNNPFTTAAIDACVYPKRASGIAAFAFDGTYVPLSSDALTPATPWPGSCEHKPGTIRVLRLQTLTIDGRTTYMTRGGTAVGQPFPGKPHVHIAAGDLKHPPALLAHGARALNGRSAPNCSRQLFARPTTLPDAMKYKPNQAPTSGATWANYGNPGERFGASYYNLLWNLPYKDVDGRDVYVRGGGILMATLKPRQRLLSCDVTAQVLNAYAPGGTTVSGWTQWVYAAVPNAAETLHGWVMVRAHHAGTTYQLFDWE